MESEFLKETCTESAFKGNKDVFEGKKKCWFALRPSKSMAGKEPGGVWTKIRIQRDMWPI